MTVPLLEIANLNVKFRLGAGDLPVSSDVSFTLDKGRVLGLIGESGSGKTITSKAILRLLPAGGEMSADHIRYNGRDIAALPPREFDRLRGADLAMIFQDPVGSFNPVKTVGWHFRKVGRLHPGGHGGIMADAAEALRQVDIADPKTTLGKYPHQLSGGMLQRCLIALVMFSKPSLIVADEPTTNLDNLVERQIIDLFDKLRREVDASFIFITHDMTIAEQVSDSIIVMYAGQIVEQGPTEALMRDPRHPYTQGLVKTARELEGDVEKLTEISGEVGTGAWPENRCRFAPRCPLYDAACDHAIALHHVKEHGEVRCIKANRSEDAI
ncbi:ABC transporter ATP-binding protein [Roseovarius spongiae]|uniref:ABC transporter ATP-binding protein n=1 Tax=Roseovarius spongiae TaxID=2320272 RepID=A0A3A8AU51_9RHOB|nr:ABC transporter ATP-binding protein [Roseovarius spongiae]RKF14170.1 ABC transporter ATP-binding protein [Roseovarius spongiae]